MNSPENRAGMVDSVEQMLTNPAKLNTRRDLLLAQGQVVRAEQRGQLNELRAGAYLLESERELRRGGGAIAGMIM